MLDLLLLMLGNGTQLGFMRLQNALVPPRQHTTAMHPLVREANVQRRRKVEVDQRGAVRSLEGIMVDMLMI